MGSVLNDVDSCHDVASIGKDIFKHVTLADDDGQVVLQL
jgi:hypothetical protein